MATKPEIKKWFKEITEPYTKPHGYKFGTLKEYGALAIFRKNNNEIVSILIDIYRNNEVQLSIFDFFMLPLTKRLYGLIENEQLLYHHVFQLPETHPYPEYKKKQDISYRKPIESKEQLAVYLQPLIDKFPENIKLIEHYKYIPNLLKKWGEVEKEYELTKNYEKITNYFPSPFHRHFIYFLAKIIGNETSNIIYNKSIEYFITKAEEFKETNARLSNIFSSRFKTLEKVKTFFDNLNHDELDKLKEEFAPFLVNQASEV